MESNENLGDYRFKNLIIKGSIFTLYSHMGPEAIFFYPIPKEISLENPNLQSHQSDQLTTRLSLRIAVKSISLLLTDYSFEENNTEELKQIEMFGVLPYPDINSIALTYFSYVYNSSFKGYTPTTFSLLVNENHRTFIYDNIYRLRAIAREMANHLKTFIEDKNVSSEKEAMQYVEELIPFYTENFEKIQKIQDQPFTPIARKRRIKILLTGLEKSGKSSFLLTIHKKFSEIPNLHSNTEPLQEPLNFLGTTIVKWDIPGAEELRNIILKDSEVYIFETDVLYYFVDIQNPNIPDTTKYLEDIIAIFKKYDSKVPIVFIFTKYDEDIKREGYIQDNIHQLREKFSTIAADHPHKYFNTSIFSAFSVLDAFSYGIRQLSPNRALIEHILSNYFKQNDVILGLIVNDSGLVLASCENVQNLFDESIAHNKVFELTASRFTSIAKVFDNFLHTSRTGTESMKFQFSPNDIVLLKEFFVDDFEFFVIFYTHDIKAEEKINQSFSKLQEKITPLLKFYIS